MNDLAAALRRAGVAEVSSSPLDRALHAADASLYRVVPQVVVRPREVDELDAVLAVARMHGVPVTARGAGTSIAGNAVGEGIVVDLARHLDRIGEIDLAAGTAWVEPGVVHAQLQARLAGTGWRFGPDPSTHSRCTIGGMIGNNACGSRALGFGRTADNVEALEVLWGTGDPGLLGPGHAPDPVARALGDVVAGDLAHVRTRFGRFSRQVSGYSLEHLLPERSRPERFLVGTEGTLALVRRARVRLVREPGARVLAVLGYPSMVHAADAVPTLLGLRERFGPAGLLACEGLDRRIVDLVPAAPALPRGEGWLFVEVAGTDHDEARGRAEEVLAAARTGTDLVDAAVISEPGRAQALWRIREDGAGLAARSLGRPAHSGWEDAAVPPERLGAWLREFEELLGEHRLSTVPYGHFGDGCVHARIDFTFEDGGAAFGRFLADCADALRAHGGSLSGEHGDGRARSALLPRMYEPRSLELFAALKRVADPDGLLNPGVVVDPVAVTADLRPARPRRPVGVVRLVDDLATDAHRCTGVGRCVAPGTTSQMCPSWQASREEKDSTRGRARALQEALDADGVLVGPGDEGLAEALDLCLSCKGCVAECPTGVDMAALKAEVTQARYPGRWGAWRRPRSHHVLGRLPALLDGPLASGPLRALARRVLGSPRTSRLFARTAGLDPQRRFPVPARTRLRGSAAGPGTGGGPDVWIWADSFTDHFGPEVAHAASRLLAAEGLSTAVIEAPACCGLTLVSTGQVRAAAAVVEATVARLAPYAATGAPILGLEPSCLATLRTDVVRLARDRTAAAAVAAASVTLAELLTRLGHTPRDLAGVRVVAQPHCHHASVLGWEADEELLHRAGAEVVRLGGCCGMAGNFGLEAGHRDHSVAVAGTQLLPALAADPGAVVLADGLSCRTQVLDLTGRRSVHLAELLAPPG